MKSLWIDFDGHGRQVMGDEWHCWTLCASLSDGHLSSGRLTGIKWSFVTKSLRL